jgi:hypothetical protein
MFGFRDIEQAKRKPPQNRAPDASVYDLIERRRTGNVRFYAGNFFQERRTEARSLMLISMGSVENLAAGGPTIDDGQWH